MCRLSIRLRLAHLFGDCSTTSCASLALSSLVTASLTAKTVEPFDALLPVAMLARFAVISVRHRKRVGAGVLE